MVLGWPPSKIVSGDPNFQLRWPPSKKKKKGGVKFKKKIVEGPNRHTFLEENHPMTISSKFSSY
jgi:hypothetical protein